MQKMLFTCEGRISRKSYWMFMLVVFAGTIITTVIDISTTGQDTGLASLLFTLIALYPSLVIQAKRWHDRDKSAWWILINIRG